MITTHACRDSPGCPNSVHQWLNSLTMYPKTDLPTFYHVSSYGWPHIETLILQSSPYLHGNYLLHSDDCSCVKLAEIEGEEGSDYINANYLDVRID